jgi:deoxyhypusine monooxygenase
MKDIRAHPILNKILQDENEDPMVRHEAAEALGAIGSPLSLPILEAYLNHENPAVRETCEIAVDRIKRAEHKTEVLAPGEIVFGSVDPAPSMAQKDLTVEQLGERLMDTSLPLYDRYKAMFSLRNRGQQEDAVLALCRGFQDESALFRHEIAYVLGQLQHPASIPALSEALRRPNEAGMVRHESAEALGSIATPECFEILKAFEHDTQDVVRESCIVALDMYDYENSDELLFFPMREDSDAEDDAAAN